MEEIKDYSSKRDELIQYINNLPDWKKGAKRLSIQCLEKMKEIFIDFIFIDKLYEYLVTTKSSHTMTRIERKIDGFYDLYILEEIIIKYHSDKEYQIKIGKLSLEKMKNEMYEYGEEFKKVSLESFKANMNGRKLSNYLRKDLGLLYYNKDYITRDELRKIIIDDYEEGSYKTEFSLKYLVKALVIRIMPRTQKTGFVNSITGDKRYNYNVYLSLDWGNLNEITSTDYKKIKELCELMCLRLKENFVDGIKYIDVGIASLYITTFSKKNIDLVKKMIRDNLIINSTEVTHQKYLKRPTRRPGKPLPKKWRRKKQREI
jgi:hypothetical protein